VQQRLKVRGKPRRQRPPMKACDELFSKLIRSVGYCQLREGAPEVECRGVLECCHIISKGYHAIRCDERNALAGCKAHHYYFTHRPIQWENWIRAKIGDPLFEELRAEALSHTRPDWREIRQQLKDRLSRLGAA
jgi:hypothetical protein